MKWQNRLSMLSRHRCFGDLLLGYNRFLRVYSSVEVSMYTALVTMAVTLSVTFGPLVDFLAEVSRLGTHFVLLHSANCTLVCL
jgi:hypothetical protein